jgi:folate-dependent phosphoribosylglycinamide formyltransferase PurN
LAVTSAEDRLRVVVFTGGPVVESDCAQFVAALASRAEIDLAGVFCETRHRGLPGVVRDLWTRRRWLMPLLLGQRLARGFSRSFLGPRAELARRRTLRRLRERIHFVEDLHSDAVLSRVARLEPDLGAVYGGPILRPELFEIPRHGTLGIHHGRLPDYRGKKTTFWAMYNGEDEVGVAIQQIGTGLDRGDVLRDARLPVGQLPLPIVRRRLERIGLDLFVEAVLCVREGSAAFRPQPGIRRALYRDPRAGDIVRFWMRYFARLFGKRGFPGSRGT